MLVNNNACIMMCAKDKNLALDALYSSAFSSVTERSKVRLPSNCWQGQIGRVEIGKRLYVWCGKKQLRNCNCCLACLK